MNCSKAVFCLFVLLSSFGCGAGISSDEAQKAVDTALDFTKKGGTIKVNGVREMDNAAQVDLQFDGFQYNADMMGAPISKNQAGPKQPDPKSSDFYSDLAKFGTEQVGTKNYSGQGTATIMKYNDGRAVLTKVQFNFVEVNANVEIP